MAVQCSNCGEELLGAVNRCWRCGQLLTPHDGPIGLPPVRRAPITEPLENVAVEAVIIESDQMPQGVRTTMRRGSPFAMAAQKNGAASGAKRGPHAVQPPAKTVSPYAATRMAGAVSIPLGAIALLLAPSFPVGAIVIAVAAISFGIWGLYTPKHTLGTIGVVIGCIALAVSVFYGTVDLYEYFYGVSPFSSPGPPPIINP